MNDFPQNLRLIIPTLLVIISGCALNDDRVAIESQLRRNEQTIRELKTALAESERHLADQDRELTALRDQDTNSTRLIAASHGASEEMKAAWGSVVAFGIHELTSGLVVDNGGGATLNLVLQPLDSQDEAVKVAGDITIRVSVISGGEPPAELLNKQFSLTDSRRLWSRGLVSTGFHVPVSMSASQLAAAQQSSQAKLYVQASLDLGGQRVYSDSMEIPVPAAE